MGQVILSKIVWIISLGWFQLVSRLLEILLYKYSVKPSTSTDIDLISVSNMAVSCKIMK